MDLDSKIKNLKESCQALDDQRIAIERRVNELKSLLEEKKKKEARLKEIMALETELLHSL